MGGRPVFLYEPDLIIASNVLDVSFSRSGEEVLVNFNTTINEKILAKLPTMFKKIPSMKLELVEESVRKSLNAKLDQVQTYQTLLNNRKFTMMSKNNNCFILIQITAY